MSEVNNKKLAQELFEQGKKLIEISKELNVPEGTIRSWKNRYKWECNATNNATLQKRNRGAPKGNKNASGGPKGNKKAETHGLFSKYLPKETLDIVEGVKVMDPLDILWGNITIQYAAIIRAQQIMHVKNQDDLTKELKRQKRSDGDTSSSWEDEYELQFAWDKHANFLQAQSRAMTALNGMIKSYDDLLHKNWDIATEEQKLRIKKLEADIAKLNGEDDPKVESDNFVEALQGKVDEVWQEK